MKLTIDNYMDFPMIFRTIQPKEIELIITDIPKEFILDALKYIKRYSEDNDAKVQLIDEDNILGLKK